MAVLQGEGHVAVEGALPQTGVTLTTNILKLQKWCAVQATTFRKQTPDKTLENYGLPHCGFQVLHSFLCFCPTLSAMDTLLGLLGAESPAHQRANHGKALSLGHSQPPGYQGVLFGNLTPRNKEHIAVIQWSCGAGLVGSEYSWASSHSNNGISEEVVHKHGHLMTKAFFHGRLCFHKSQHPALDWSVVLGLLS